MHDADLAGVPGEAVGPGKSAPCALPHEPLAIIGIGCRFPGEGNDPASFWKLLQDGVDATREVPADRWNKATFFHPEMATPGKSHCCRGGFLAEIDQFDAGFFGISPREAAGMDPQQRLLLEVACESLEDAGLPLASASRVATGVYVGLSGQDYALMQHNERDLTRIDAHTNTGVAMSITANRISYCLNLHGPNLAVDTACSSSLVAVHLACQGIWNGDCQQALAGGAHVLIKPEPYIGFSRMSMLSPTGSCKAFDASADGFARSEGAAIVVLKRLSDALRDRDRIYAVILASAVNQDGRTSSLTVPGEDAQAELLRVACANAGIRPDEVQYVEAHGTGTLVGDPIEARALARVLCTGREPDRPCVIGSVKTNIGHLEPASGIAGLVKAALSVQQRMIPPNLHFHRPNPAIPFEQLKLRVSTRLAPWPDANRPLLAGVNSFGFGGTNAHVLLREPPPAAADAEPLTGATLPDAGPQLYVLSARNTAALREYARACAARLDEAAPEPLRLEDFRWTSAMRRNHYDERLAVTAATRGELLAGLAAYLQEEPGAGVSVGRAESRPAEHLAFVFSGQGPQWWGMGRELYDQEPVFRAALEACDRHLAELAAWSLIEELSRDEATSRIQETAIAQPAIFAVQYALAQLLLSWGIRPAAVVGHSVGEVAAACIAGTFTLEQAVRVIFHRGRCMNFAGAHGRMLAVGVSPAAARDLLAGHEAKISLAAVNDPQSVTLSGDGEVLEAIAGRLEEQGIFNRFLRVDYAFHSLQLDPMRESLLAALDGLQPSEARLPLYSTVTGARCTGLEMNADYWWDNARRTVQFAGAVDAMLADQYRVFLEVAPHPVLRQSVAETARVRQAAAEVIPTLRRQEPEKRQLVQALGALYTQGIAPQWEVVIGSGNFVQLPRYPWQRERFWSESRECARHRIGPAPHPLLGERLPAAHPTWEQQVHCRHLRYLADHRVQGHAVLPATGFLEMALAANRACRADGKLRLEDIEFSRLCFLPEDDGLMLQLAVEPNETDFSIYSRPKEVEPWHLHARGKMRVFDEPPPPVAELSSLQARCPRQVGEEACYAELEELGLEYGPAFRGVESLWIGTGEALGRIRTSVQLAARDGTLDRYHVHPAILDTCFHVILGTLPDRGKYQSGAGGVFLPVAVDQLRVHAGLSTNAWSHARLLRYDGRTLVADVMVYDDAGAPLVEVRGLRCQLVDSRGAAARDTDDFVYQYLWEPASRSSVLRSRGTRSEFSPREFLQSIASDTRRVAARHQLQERYRVFDRDMSELCAHYVGHALAALGVDLSPGAVVSVAGLLGHGVHERYTRLLRRYLDLLAEHGWLVPGSDPGGNSWCVARAIPGVDLAERWNACLRRHPAWYAEFVVVRRCAERLAEILRDEVDPLRVVFADGSFAMPDQLYQDSPSVRIHHTLSQWAIAGVLEQLPRDRHVRLIEVGAGTGGLTSYVLPELPAHRATYVYTDISSLFFSHAQEKFRSCDQVEFRKFDLDGELAEQGFEPHSFDVVLASFALHAARDVRRGLARVRELLRPGGVLLLAETVGSVRWFDLTFGLTGSWWTYDDLPLRPDSPLMSLSGWRDLLAESGFREVTELTGLEDAAATNATLLALAPADTEASLSATVEEPELPTDTPGRWLVLADRGGVAERVCEHLESRGQSCTQVLSGAGYRIGPDGRLEMAPDEVEYWTRLVQEFSAAPGPVFRGVLHFWNLDAPSADEMTTAQLDAMVVPGCLSIVYLTQALTATHAIDAPRLWIMTRDAVAAAAGDDPSGTSQTPAWGLGRVVSNEAPILRTTMVDLSAEASAVECEALAAELLLPEEETADDEVALRGATRYVHRFQHVRDQMQCPGSRRRERVGARPFRLETPRSGSLDKLALYGAERPGPGPDDVEIQVAATGLNFSDVMKVLGVYPDVPPGPLPIGLECSGVISAVGEHVTDWRVGDEVVAVANCCFSTYVTTPAEFIERKPPDMTFEEAATLPVAFLTAYYALQHVGRLEAGERVLIHSATGGVGLAAIQLARRLGAEVFATAGTAEKRDFLRYLGVPHVMDSRTLAFADEIMAATAGRGVDVVLNSLSGQALVKSLDVLAPGGRFLEIGKRDIYADTRIGLKPFRKQISVSAIDMVAMQERPRFIHGLFQAMMRDLGSGVITSLPHRIFPVGNASAAFRYMAQARHIGKVVVSSHEQKVRVLPPRPMPPQFRPDATYLITGGLGGFGLVIAQWLVAHGARHLALVGRSGVKTSEQQAVLDALRSSGANVTVWQADVSRDEDVERLFREVRTQLPPLRGLFHTAMVLNDCLLGNLNEERMREVWAPKASGAWNLHRHTVNEPLDFFVLFSSLACVLGSPGQANYSAANAFLDGLADYRRARGLPACTISWGFLGDVGWLSRHGDIAQRVQSQGIFSFSPREALALLGQFILQRPVAVSVLNMDWRRWGMAIGRNTAPKFAHLIQQASSDQDGQAASITAVRSELLAASPERRAELLEQVLRQRVARVLGVAADRIDATVSLTELGLDSLMGIEIKNWIETELRLNVSTVELMKGPTIARLVELLSAQLASSESGESPPAAPAREAVPRVAVEEAEGDSAMALVDELSDDEVDALLESMGMNETSGGKAR